MPPPADPPKTDTTDTTQSDKAAAAEARAKAAEERASQLEADRVAREQAAREKDAAKKAKKAADLDTANSRIADLEARERKAMERVASLEKQRVDDHLSGLTEEQRKTAEKYRSRMGTDDFLELVADMFKPVSASGGDDEHPTTNGAAPPAATPRGPGPKIKPQGRELHAETLMVLRQHMNEHPETAQRLLEAQHSGTQYRYIVPVDKLIRFMRERVQYGKRMSPEERKRLLDAIQ